MHILIDNGTYELMNLGDVAMLQAAVGRLRALWPDARVTVVTTHPHRLAMFLPDVRPLSPDGRDWWLRRTDLFRPLHRRLPRAKAWLLSLEERLRRQWPRPVLRMARKRLRGRGQDPEAMAHFVDAVLQSDLVLASGGGYVTDAFAEHAIDVLETLDLATSLGIPTAMLGQGLGPVTQDRVAVPLRRVLPQLGRLFVREPSASKALAVRFGADPKTIAVTGDDAVEMAYAARPTSLGNALGVNLRTAWYADVPGDALPVLRDAIARVLADLNALPVPLPVSLHDGGEDERAILRLTGAAEPGRPLQTPADLIGRTGLCRLVITGSYHAGVFALAQGIPVIGLARSDYYHAKFAGLAEQFGVGCEIVRPDGPDLRTRLVTSARRLWDTAEQLRVPLLRAAAAQVKAGQAAYASLMGPVAREEVPHARPTRFRSPAGL